MNGRRPLSPQPNPTPYPTPPPQPHPHRRELWLECARRAFEGLDADSDGRLTVDSLIATLRAKLPAAEVDYAVEDALVEAGYAGALSRADGSGDQRWSAVCGRASAADWGGGRRGGDGGGGEPVQRSKVFMTRKTPAVPSWHLPHQATHERAHAH